jgi:hypothetical protein
VRPKARSTGCDWGVLDDPASSLGGGVVGGLVGPLGHRAVEAVGQPQHRRGGAHGQRQPPVEGEHQHRHRGRGDDAGQQHAEQVHGHADDAGGTGPDELADRADAVAGEPAKRQRGQVVGDADLHRLQQPQPHVEAGHGLRVVGDPAGGHGHHHYGQPPARGGGVALQEGAQQRHQQRERHALEHAVQHDQHDLAPEHGLVLLPRHPQEPPDHAGLPVAAGPRGVQPCSRPRWCAAHTPA